MLYVWTLVLSVKHFTLLALQVKTMFSSTVQTHYFWQASLSFLGEITMTV